MERSKINHGGGAKRGRKNVSDPLPNCGLFKKQYTKQGKKGLIFDVNNEFGNVRDDHGNAKFPNIGLIKLSQVPAFAKVTRPFAKRVSIFKDDGQRMTLAEMAQALGY